LPLQKRWAGKSRLVFHVFEYFLLKYWFEGGNFKALKVLSLKKIYTWRNKSSWRILFSTEFCLLFISIPFHYVLLLSDMKRKNFYNGGKSRWKEKLFIPLRVEVGIKGEKKREKIDFLPFITKQYSIEFSNERIICSLLKKEDKSLLVDRCVARSNKQILFHLIMWTLKFECFWLMGRKKNVDRGINFIGWILI
jgi:hypothetical protein